jgi:hypothetical protein
MKHGVTLHFQASFKLNMSINRSMGRTILNLQGASDPCKLVSLLLISTYLSAITRTHLAYEKTCRNSLVQFYNLQNWEVKRTLSPSEYLLTVGQFIVQSQLQDKQLCVHMVNWTVSGHWY